MVADYLLHDRPFKATGVRDNLNTVLVPEEFSGMARQPSKHITTPSTIVTRSWTFQVPWEPKERSSEL